MNLPAFADQKLLALITEEGAILESMAFPICDEN